MPSPRGLHGVGCPPEPTGEELRPDEPLGPSKRRWVDVPVATSAVPALIRIHGGGGLDGDRRFPPPTVPVDLLHGSVPGAGLDRIRSGARRAANSPPSRVSSVPMSPGERI